MRRGVVWGLVAVLAVVGVVGIIGLIGNGSCGCSDPNYVCAAPPCPGSDTLWFICTFAGAFGAPLLLTGALFMGHNQRLLRYQRQAGPVSAEINTGPVQMPALNTVFSRPAWSTPPITPIASPAATSQPFGGALGGVSTTDSGAGSVDAAERLRQLTELDQLRQSGALTQVEFDEQKRRLLGET